MNKAQRINLTIKKLKEEREELEEQVRAKEELLEEQMGLYRNLYPDFFATKTNSDFILYNKFPPFKQIQTYYSKNAQYNNFNHPIDEYGQFDIRELAEVIKLLYSYQRQKEYQVLTMGFLQWNPVSDTRLDPNLYFLIGNDKTLKDYQEYQNCFLEEDSRFKFEGEYIQDLIGVNAEINRSYQHYPSDTLLPISCFPNEYIKKYSKDSTYSIYYFDWLARGTQNRCVQYKKDTNIFERNMCEYFVHYKGIKDTLSFPIHIHDSFIAKALISIAIYKKNNKKTSLSNEDYRYIFYELYKEDVDIQKEIQKDIPKTLKYIIPR